MKNFWIKESTWIYILNHVMSLSLLWKHQNFEYALPKEVSTKCRRKKDSFKMWNIRISWGLKISAFEFTLVLKPLFLAAYGLFV